MAYEHIFTPLQVGSLTLENRILLPPMVTFGLSGADGNVTQDVIRHYAARARGGAGLLIVEATCVHPDGKLTEHQLGLWDDAQIEGHQMLTDAVHAFDRPVLVQLHHAGGKAVGDVRVSASAYEDHGRTARAMTERDVQACIQDFLAAAQRAQQAGYDGVEVHGAHGYLLSQFFCADVNRRTDAYGGSLENRARMAVEIVSGIKRACGAAFVVSVRMGCNEPDVAGSVALGRLLAQAGADLLDISNGFLPSDTLPPAPQGFAFSPRVYLASQMRAQLPVPVACVGGVRTPQQAEAILQQGLSDLVAVGRGQLSDEQFVNKARKGQTPNLCLDCRRCQWYTDGRKCPAQLRATRLRHVQVPRTLC